MKPPSKLEAAVGSLAAKWLFALIVGTGVATVALLIRIQIPGSIAGSQAIFSYPAIAIATLLYGARAGSVTASVCFPFLWYYVVPPRRSFAIEDWPAAITLAMYVLVGAVLIWTIARMRAALRRYHDLNLDLARQVERRTAERNRLWQRSRELLAIVREDDRVHAANPALCRLAGLDGAETIATSFEALIVDEDRERYREARAGGDTIFEARLKTSGEPAWVSWSVASGEAESYLIGRDFTAEHHCGEQLRQSQKMELVGQLAGGLAHDFGNLVPPISMTLHLLGRRHAEDGRTRELIEAAQESIERADKLIKRLLALSRPSRLQAEPRAIGPLLEKIAPLLRQAVGDRTLEIRLDRDLPMIRVDSNQLDMALLNLVLNARDATAEHGRIELTIDGVGGERVDIAVADDGHGMDGRTLAHATEPFFSTKASGEGSGLGLSMVHNFAVAAGGGLSLRSSPDGGTRATISLPAVARVGQEPKEVASGSRNRAATEARSGVDSPRPE